jgi:hypothetical protein
MPRKSSRRLAKARYTRSLLMPIMFMAIIIVASAFFAPIFPSLTVTFRLAPSPVSGNVPVISLDSTLYEKLSATNAAGIPKGKIILVSFTNTTGPPSQYFIRIDVTYQNKLLSPPEFFAVGGGVGYYQAKVVYSPLSEQANIPYSVGISASTLQNSTFIGLVVNILPS